LTPPPAHGIVSPGKGKTSGRRAQGAPGADGWQEIAVDSSDVAGRRRYAPVEAAVEGPEGAFEVAARIAPVLVGVSVLMATSGALSGLASQALDDLAQLGGGVFAAWACAWTWQRSRLLGRPRNQRTWRLLLFVGVAGWTCGQAIWSWYQLVADEPIPSPSAADVGYFLLPVFAVPALLALPTMPALPPAPSDAVVPGRDHPLARLLVTLDATIIVTSLFLLTWSTALGAIVHTGAPTPAAFAVAVGYPVTDLVMVVIVLLSAVFRRPRSPVTLLLLGAGLVALSVSDSLFLYLVAAGAEDMPPINDIGFVAGPVLLGLAALVPEPGRRHSRPVRSTRTDTWFDFLPYLPLGGMGLLVILQQVRGPHPGQVEIYGLIVLVGFVVVRQLLTLLQNRELLRRVQEGQDQLHHQAFHDWLTGLPNRALFRDRLEAALELHQECGRQLALLFCDLDDFKGVNDTLGHSAGDALLRVVATRLRQSVRAGDTVARVGGDEFAIIVDDEEASPRAVGERVLAARAAPLSLGDRSVPARASVGLVVLTAGDLADNADHLLYRADAAMYEAKRAGKNRLVVADLTAMARVDEYEPGGPLELLQTDDVPRHERDADDVVHGLGTA
jgi:diguanylate cyclase (GGDEF)-like protein